MRKMTSMTIGGALAPSVVAALSIVAGAAAQDQQIVSDFLRSTAAATSSMTPPTSMAAELTGSMGRLAADLSRAVSNVESRGDLAAQIKTSPRKGILVMEDYLKASLRTTMKADPGAALQLAGAVQQIEELMHHCGLEVARLELKLPVREHRDLLATAETVYVAVSPPGEESQVKEIAAYTNGRRVILDAAEPPAEPILFILPAEEESADPVYPLSKSDDPGEESNGDRVVDDYVGVARIWIDNDHEGWWCGDPEIYVRVLRFYFPTFSVFNNRVNLPGVNGERVWYNVGDPNGTYRYVGTTNHAPVVQFQVWEDDNFWCGGGDDHLGTINITWTSLPFGGYTTFVNGDARLRIDRD